MKTSAWDAIKIFLGNRLGLIAFVYGGLALLPTLNPEVPFWRAFPDNLFFDGWARWDSGWYRDIALQGYTNLAVNIQGQRDTAFFPLFPLTVRLVQAVVPNVYAAGLLVSFVAALVAVLVFYRLTATKFGADVARAGLIAWLVFPFSFYLTAMYSESLFVLLAVSAFYNAEKKRWLAAALCAALAGATRVVGVITGLGVLLLYLDQIRYDRRQIRSDILWLLLCPAGLIAHMLFLWRRFGDPFVFIASQNAEGWSGSWSLMREFAGHIPLNTLIHLAFLVPTLFLLVAYWRRLTLPYAVWSAVTLAISLSAWKVTGRMLVPIFPLFIAAGSFLTDRPKWREPVIYASTLLLALFSFLFSHWFWSGG